MTESISCNDSDMSLTPNLHACIVPELGLTQCCIDANLRCIGSNISLIRYCTAPDICLG